MSLRSLMIPSCGSGRGPSLVPKINGFAETLFPTSLHLTHLGLAVLGRLDANVTHPWEKHVVWHSSKLHLFVLDSNRRTTKSDKSVILIRLVLESWVYKGNLWADPEHSQNKYEQTNFKSLAAPFTRSPLLPAFIVFGNDCLRQRYYSLVGCKLVCKHKT